MPNRRPVLSRGDPPAWHKGTWVSLRVASELTSIDLDILELMVASGDIPAHRQRGRVMVSLDAIQEATTCRESVEPSNVEGVEIPDDLVDPTLFDLDSDGPARDDVSRANKNRRRATTPPAGSKLVSAESEDSTPRTRPRISPDVTRRGS